MSPTNAARYRQRTTIVLASLSTICVVVALAAYPFGLGLSLVVRAADRHGYGRALADLTTVPISERIIGVPAAHAWIRGRIYAPVGRSRQTVLLISGLHPAGIDEPRLVFLSRQLAKSRVTVFTPEIPELARFEITTVLTDRIEVMARWLSIDSGLAPSGRVGMIGVSFSGGLSTVAAGRPSLRNHVSFVLSLGGHDDLPRVIGYLCAEGDPGRSPANILTTMDWQSCC
jgi:hypothetical protein